jgi:hypothetical protein
MVGISAREPMAQIRLTPWPENACFRYREKKE